jgi:hypothetical protein
VQICAPMFDVNFVLANYGLRGVLIEIAFIEICNAIFLRDAIADPCPLVSRAQVLRRTIAPSGQFLQNKKLLWLKSKFKGLFCSIVCKKSFVDQKFYPSGNRT